MNIWTLTYNSATEKDNYSLGVCEYIVGLCLREMLLTIISLLNSVDLMFYKQEGFFDRRINVGLYLTRWRFAHIAMATIILAFLLSGCRRGRQAKTAFRRRWRQPMTRRRLLGRIHLLCRECMNGVGFWGKGRGKC